MSRKEKIISIIDFIKAFLLALTTALFAICGYVFINSDTISLTKLIIVTCGVFVIIIIFIVLIKYLIKFLNELERL